jgi:hypothetical protein
VGEWRGAGERRSIADGRAVAFAQTVHVGYGKYLYLEGEVLRAGFPSRAKARPPFISCPASASGVHTTFSLVPHT